MSVGVAEVPLDADRDERKLLRRCKYCHRELRFRCDAPGCRARLCEIHAHYLGDQLHRCKEHAPP